MKKLIMFSAFIALFLMKSSAQTSKLTNLGLVSQLVEMKYVSEAYLSGILSQEPTGANYAANKKEAIKNYNLVRVQVDRIIYQLAADMKRKNSVCLYKKLEKYYKKHNLSDTQNAKNCYKNYSEAIATAYGSYYQMTHQQGPSKALAIDAIISLIENAWTMAKDIHEMRGKKVDGIVEILNNLRLNPPSDLNKKEKEEKPK